MADLSDLRDPWLLAVWPGMGNVSIAAGGYLLQKLGADYVDEMPAPEQFDVQHVEVHHGVTTTGQQPRNMLFVVRHPDPEGHDLVVFVGEAQPQHGGMELCRRIIERAMGWGVQRCFTFAAMGTQVHPSEEPRVFAAATSEALIREIEPHGVSVLDEGQISGLNGVLLAAAAERGLEGVCLLGEMPYFAAGVPNPKASHAVLEVFTQIAGLEIDLDELAEQAEQMEDRLIQLLEQLSESSDTEESEFTVPEVAKAAQASEESTDEPEPPKLTLQQRQRIEDLFDQARRDRSKAFELKRELDRLGVFKQYEDRFLDLFRKGE